LSQLRQRTPEFTELGATILAVSPDGPEQSQALAEAQELAFALLSDPELRVADLYGVRHEDEPRGRLIPRPATFVLDAAGKVQYAYVGENPSDRPDEAELLAVVRSLPSIG
jgi:peroxiredoxin